jgi:restriction system protein
MGRRSKTSLFEDLTELASRLPWWVSIGLAVLSFAIFRGLAQQAPSVNPLAIMVHAAAIAGQFIAPAIFVLGGALSAWRGHERRELLARTAHAGTADALDGMTWQQFERLVGAAFELRGFDVVETGGGGADGGVDLVLKRGSEKHLVQCKQWRASKVGVDVVRELYGVMAARGAAGGYVVTSGRFTQDAQLFAAGRNVHLVEGQELMAMIKKVMPSDVQGSRVPAQLTPARPAVAPGCPRCNKPMVHRVAKRGANAGSGFWGCSGYPACRGTRPDD